MREREKASITFCFFSINLEGCKVYKIKNFKKYYKKGLKLGESKEQNIAGCLTF